MPDTIKKGDFDVEAQEALLGREAETDGAVLTAAETRSVDIREVIRRVILVIRSTKKFKLEATYASDHTSTSSDYVPIEISDEQAAQDSGDVAVPEEILTSPCHSVAENENTIILQSAQTESIREIVKEQNLEDLHKFGGVAGVAEALSSHLTNGLPILQPNTSQRKSCQISQVSSTFCKCFLDASNNYTVLLLSAAAALSLIFGLMEQGFAGRWFINGGIILCTVVALVICSTVHSFIQLEWRSLKNYWRRNRRKVTVIRGGDPVLVPECSLLVGDIAVLQRWSQIPGDGIFIDGQALQLDLQSTIDETKPFMFYGSIVTNGNGRMIVTSTGMDTVVGEMMSPALGCSPDKKSKLEACVDKLTSCVHFAGLLISILIIIVVFLRHYNPGSYTLDHKGEPTKVETVLDCIKAFFTGSKVSDRVLTTLSVSLLGIMEGIPFVISVAIFIWNRKTLGGKASKRDFLALVRMASVTTICSDKFGWLSEHEMEINNLTKAAISTLEDGGIKTILASEDEVEVLRMIGESLGVLEPSSADDQVALTAEEFRSWTNEEKIEKIEKIRVMGNCLPSDKILLIEFLKEKGEVVAFLGQRTFDAPALKQADIGLTFGPWSSEFAKESADINIWQGDFSFLVDLIENSRCFQENIKKFIQLELIIAISSSSINFIATAVFLGDAPITAVQLLLLNLLVAVVGGLALLMGPATKALMNMSPVKSSTKLITKAMWRNIAIQTIYQTSICVTLQYKGHTILGASRGHIKSLIYKAFFMCQMFIMFVVREPEKKNIFRGLFNENWWFWVAIVMFIIHQAVDAVVEAAIGSSSGLSLKLWGVCLLIALVPWLLDLAGKSVSNLVVKRATTDQG